MHRERTQYNNIILRRSGGVLSVSSRRTCVYILCAIHIMCFIHITYIYIYREREGEVYTYAHAVPDSAGTHVRRRRYLWIAGRARGGYFFSPSHFHVLFFVSFCLVFLRNGKKPLPALHHRSYTGWLAHIIIVYLCHTSLPSWCNTDQPPHRGIRWRAQIVGLHEI